jgi:hypothetical protein
MLDNIYLASFVVFISQIAFVYLRTINVIYTADRNLWGSIITGNGIGLTWLIVTSIGVSSVLKGEFIPIIFFLLGGTIGNYIAIKQKQNKG